MDADEVVAHLSFCVTCTFFLLVIASPASLRHIIDISLQFRILRWV